MRRLVPGTRIHLPDGRRMIVQRIETIDGIRFVWWYQLTKNGHVRVDERPVSRIATGRHLSVREPEPSARVLEFSKAPLGDLVLIQPEIGLLVGRRQPDLPQRHEAEPT